MIEVEITLLKGKKTCRYQVTRDKGPSTSAEPDAPNDSNGDPSNNVILGVGFSVRLTEFLLFKCKHPFTAFYRYGRPDGGDINDLDELKQVRSESIKDQAGKVLHHAASVCARIQGLYAPVVIIHDGNKFHYDRGLSFEVHPAGS